MKNNKLGPIVFLMSSLFSTFALCGHGADRRAPINVALEKQPVSYALGGQFQKGQIFDNGNFVGLISRNDGSGYIEFRKLRGDGSFKSWCGERWSEQLGYIVADARGNRPEQAVSMLHFSGFRAYGFIIRVFSNNRALVEWKHLNGIIPSSHWESVALNELQIEGDGAIEALMLNHQPSPFFKPKPFYKKIRSLGAAVLMQQDLVPRVPFKKNQLFNYKNQTMRYISQYPGGPLQAKPLKSDGTFGSKTYIWDLAEGFLTARHHRFSVASQVRGIDPMGKVLKGTIALLFNNEKALVKWTSCDSKLISNLHYETVSMSTIHLDSETIAQQSPITADGAAAVGDITEGIPVTQLQLS